MKQGCGGGFRDMMWVKVDGVWIGDCVDVEWKGWGGMVMWKGCIEM